MYEFRKHHFTSWQDHKKSSDCRLPSYSFVLFSWKLFEIKTKNYEAIRVDLFLPQKSIKYAVLKTVLYDQCHVIMHIILQGSYDHFFAKKKQLKNLPFWQWLHCTMEEKTTVSSTLLLLVLVLLLCSSNTESASYGDRNQGGAIFYCANTEKVVL